ncbi:MAG: PAS domain-containing sensor histidine kinase [Thermomonas sp.]|uniref:sensor histidine kinase n=1 Tax=Thermomonas sp. TaxID=1971895 RepID=UPI001EC1D80C|nr:histidine kinase dimerization/phospho-acceptor domain-containing protein [Thermomonas sp.]MBV2208817.1 PAS domain-containing sensor histidine kinase [Thermomonas sp.]
MPPAPTPPEAPELQAAIRRELHYFALYRLLEAALLCLAIFSPIGQTISMPSHPILAGSVALLYLLAAGLLFSASRQRAVQPQVIFGIGCDIFATVLAIAALPGIASGLAMMLLFNVGAAALLLPLRSGLTAAGAATTALLVLHVWTLFDDNESARRTTEVLMFSISYLAVASVTSVLGKQMRTSQALAEHRGSQIANLAEVNELIIRRMRTGVLLVDGDGEIRLANESAMLHLGEAGEGRRLLAAAAPELDKRLRLWERTGKLDATPLQLASGLPEVLPRFAKLLAGGEQVLVFLDDVELASRRAETLTLATLGRFSASLAHEIRNPLAAISYATQLLEESKEIPESDRRLLEIIYQQTRRMNGIIENVLGLARRERAQPEHVELCEFARQFVQEYCGSHPLEPDTLTAKTEPGSIACLVDARQLQQVVTVLVHNAQVYGRIPGEPAHITLHAHRSAQDVPLLDIVDRGPGIPDAVSAQLFRPFFTTSSHGTGLGLYIAKEMCLANQADLSYVALPAGGACFRIRLAGAHAINTH